MPPCPSEAPYVNGEQRGTLSKLSCKHETKGIMGLDMWLKTDALCISTHSCTATASTRYIQYLNCIVLVSNHNMCGSSMTHSSGWKWLLTHVCLGPLQLLKVTTTWESCWYRLGINWGVGLYHHWMSRHQVRLQSQNGSPDQESSTRVVTSSTIKTQMLVCRSSYGKCSAVGKLPPIAPNIWNTH